MKYKKSIISLSILLGIGSIYYLSTTDIPISQNKTVWDNNVYEYFTDNDLQKLTEKLSSSSDPQALFILAMLYKDLNNFEDQQKAELYLQKAAELGSGAAAYNLAFYYLTGKLQGTNDDFAKYHQKAMDLKVADAFLLPLTAAEVYEKKIGKLTPELAKKYTQSAFDISPSSKTRLFLGGALLLPESNADTATQKKAVELLEKSLAEGEIVAAIILQEIYSDDNSPLYNASKARTMNSLIEKQGFNMFSAMLDITASEKPLIEPSNPKWKKIIQKVRDEANNNGKSAFILARLYHNGIIPYAPFSSVEEARNAYLQKAIDLENYEDIVNFYKSLNRYAAQDIIPYLTKVAEKNYAPALFLLSDHYENSYDEDNLATDYLLKAASLGDFDAQLKLAQVYQDGGRNYEIDPDLNKAEKLNRELIASFPERYEPHFQLLKTLFKQPSSINTQAEIAQLISHLDQVKMSNEDLYNFLFMKGLHYYNPSDQQDYVKSFKNLEDLIALHHSDDASEFAENYTDLIAQFYQASMLKNGSKNFPKDEAKALELFTKVYEQHKYTDVADELGSMYEFGIATDINLDKAIDFYQHGSKKTQENLGLLLLNKDDPELKDEGTYYLIQTVKRDQTRQDLKTKLLQYPESSNVQAWVYDVYKYSNYVDDIDAFNYAKKHAEAGIIPAQFYYANMLIMSDKEKENDEGYNILDKLIADNYQPAILYALDKSQSIPKKKILLDRLTPLLSTDDELHKQAERYERITYYDEALALYDKVVDKERTFFSMDRKSASDKKEKLDALIQKVQGNDESALIELIDFYIKQENIEALTQLFAKGKTINSDKSALLQAKYLLNQNNDKASQVAKNIYKESIKNGSIDGIEAYFNAYLNDLIPDLNHDQMGLFLFSISKAQQNNSEIAKEYSDQLIQFDAELSLLTEIEAGEMDGSFKSIEQKNKRLTKLYKKIIDAYTDKDIMPKDLSAALIYQKKLAELGDGRANYEVGNAYIKGEIVPFDFVEAVKWFKKAVQNKYSGGTEYIEFYDNDYVPYQAGDIDAMFRVGKFYSTEYPFQYRDDYKNEGNALIEKAAELHSLPALRYFAKQNIDSNDKDLQEKSIQYLQYAINQGDLTAMYDLVYFYQKNPENLDKSIEALQDLMIKTSSELDQDNIYRTNYYSAYGLLTEIYLKNNNIDELLNLLNAQPQIILESDVTYTIYRQLMKLYENGNDTNFDKALTYSKLLYPNDHTIGYKIVDLYSIGDNSLPKNEPEALSWLQKTAEDTFKTDQYDYNYRLDITEYLDNLMPYATDLLSGYGNFEASSNNQQIAEKLLQSIVMLDDNRPAEALYKYYSNKKDFKNAYLYGSLSTNYKIENNIDKLTKQLNPEDKKVMDVKIKDLKDQREYSEYLPKLNQLIEKSKQDGDFQKVSLYELGRVYLGGRLTAVNIEKAEYYLNKSGKLGYDRAYNFLGNEYRKGDDTFPKDMEKALYYFDLGAQINSSNCAHQAGDLLYFGEGGLPKDEARAAQYFEMTDLSQGQHHFSAKYKASLIYFNGLGNAKQNKAKAKELLENIRYTNDKDVIKAIDTWDFEDTKLSN